MSIIDRIKHLKPKQWAMIVGGVGALGLGVDYYRRREGSLVGRAWDKIHPAPPPPPMPAPQQRRPAAPSMPGGAPSFDMGQLDMGEMPQMPMGMGGEVIVEEMPGYYGMPYPWYERAWWPREGHGFGPHHEHHEFHGGHPQQHAQHAQPQHGAPPQQHGAPQQPQQQHGAPPPSGQHHH